MPNRFKDKTGMRFGTLIVVRMVSRNPIKWECRCDCGKVIEVGRTGLNRGRVSCGQLHNSSGCSGRQITHGETRGGKASPELQSFSGMLRRCNNPNDNFYNDYGGRGIRVCPEWNHISKFPEFLAHVGRKPTPRHTIDRIDHNGHYEPGNVRWATQAEQMRNTRRTHFFTINGEKLCLTDWCLKYKVSRGLVKVRLKLGWPILDALTVPILHGTTLRLSHLTPEQKRERDKAKVKAWQIAHPEEMKAYAEERVKRNRAARA